MYVETAIKMRHFKLQFANLGKCMSNNNPLDRKRNILQFQLLNTQTSGSPSCESADLDSTTIQ